MVKLSELVGSASIIYIKSGGTLTIPPGRARSIWPLRTHHGVCVGASSLSGREVTSLLGARSKRALPQIVVRRGQIDRAHYSLHNDVIGFDITGCDKKKRLKWPIKAL